jgi:hypothetical protein
VSNPSTSSTSAALTQGWASLGGPHAWVWVSSAIPTGTAERLLKVVPGPGPELRRESRRKGPDEFRVLVGKADADDPERTTDREPADETPDAPF